MKVLIIGGGNAATRYIESLIWDQEQKVTLCGMGVLNKTKKLGLMFGLPYISYDSLLKTNINDYDCIIVTLPPDVKRKYVEQIVDEYKYKNGLILEKPLCINNEDLEYYKKLENKEKVAVVCQRDFDLKNYKITESTNYKVVFKTVFDDIKSNIINQLPHILSWFYEYGLIFDNISIKDEEVAATSKNCELKIKFSKNVDFNIKINDIIYEQVNYRKINKNIVKTVVAYDNLKTKQNINKAIYVSRLIIELLKKENL